MHQRVGAARGVDQRRAIGGVAAEGETLAGGLEHETEGVLDRQMVDGDGPHAKIAGGEYFARGDFRDVDFQGARRRPLFMRDALLKLRLPQRQQPIDEALGADRPEHALRPVAALMPARDHQLEQIDDVVGMQMREQHGVEIAARGTGGDQALRDTGAAIDEIGFAGVAHEIGGPEPVGIALRTAGAEEGQLHLRPVIKNWCCGPSFETARCAGLLRTRWVLLI